MGYCPNCGSYVSPGTNVCSCGTTFSYRQESERKPTEFEKQREEKRKITHSYYKIAEKLMDEGKYLEAIEYIDRALERSENGFYIKKKAMAYYFAGLYSESLDFFNRALEHYRGIDSFVIYEWIGDTLIELYRFDEAIEAYRQAIDIVNEDYERTINFHREQRWDCPSDEYYRSLLSEKNQRISGLNDRISYANELKREILQRLENDTDEQKRFLRNLGKENFITITGTGFHGNPKFEKAEKLRLVKEPGNRYDKKAVAVYSPNGKVGYVANSVRTCSYLTSMADDIRDVDLAEYMFYYAYSYHIARIIR
ncbi:HIRAN domain-containing protein [Methanobrevibacter sp.]|uniref:HIRAN domain-containing protein n=1 Tax=Methanobrevibacter sp. TaxID=66852 RepID=UPI00388F2C6A